MMDRIILTTREREVATLMMTGQTRPQIAEALHVSEDTIKKHVASITRKCGASNQREASTKLYMNDMIYGESGLEADFFVECRRVEFFLYADRKRSTMTARSKQICVRDGVTEKLGDVYCDGEVDSVLVDGEMPNQIRKEKGRIYYSTKFERPLSAGDVLERTVKTTMSNAFSFPADYVFIEQPLPCERLTIEVRLDLGLEFEHVEFDASLGTHSFVPESEHREQSSRRVLWQIDNPRVLGAFTVRWALEQGM